MQKNTSKILQKLNSKKGLRYLLSEDSFGVERAIRYLNYLKRLKQLQVELIRLQTDVIAKNKRVLVLFEGRDAAGKGGAIRRITECIDPRNFRIVALPKPSEEEQTQWYFQRYIPYLPRAGEMVFFDRSWYNRAVVEPVNHFCTSDQYQIFMGQVNDFEKMIVDSGIILLKIYMSISKREQAKRFEYIQNNPLKKWKMTLVDKKAQELWEDYAHYKNLMFEITNTKKASWKIIKANRKTVARMEVIQYLLSQVPYDKTLKI